MGLAYGRIYGFAPEGRSHPRSSALAPGPKHGEPILRCTQRNTHKAYTSHEWIRNLPSVCPAEKLPVLFEQGKARGTAIAVADLTTIHDFGSLLSGSTTTYQGSPSVTT